jgi:hypothetical protein
VFTMSSTMPFGFEGLIKSSLIRKIIVNRMIQIKTYRDKWVRGAANKLYALA